MKKRKKVHALKILYKLESKPPPKSKPLLESKPPFNAFLMGKSVIETLLSKVSPGLTIQIIQYSKRHTFLNSKMIGFAMQYTAK